MPDVPGAGRSEHVLWMSSIRVFEAPSNKGSATGRQVLPIAVVKFRIILTRSQNRSLMVWGAAGRRRQMNDLVRYRAMESLCRQTRCFARWRVGGCLLKLRCGTTRRRRKSPRALWNATGSHRPAQPPVQRLVPMQATKANYWPADRTTGRAIQRFARGPRICGAFIWQALDARGSDSIRDVSRDERLSEHGLQMR